jgi:hypothetical protein
MAGDQGRASLCDIAGKKRDKADLKGVQIQPAAFCEKLATRGVAELTRCRRNPVRRGGTPRRLLEFASPDQPSRWNFPDPITQYAMSLAQRRTAWVMRAADRR